MRRESAINNNDHILSFIIRMVIMRGVTCSHGCVVDTALTDFHERYATVADNPAIWTNDGMIPNHRKFQRCLLMHSLTINYQA